MKKYIILSANSPDFLTKQIQKFQENNTIISTQFNTSAVPGNSKFIVTYSVLIEYEAIVVTPQLPKNNTASCCIKCNGKGLTEFRVNNIQRCKFCSGKGYIINS